MQAKPDLCPLCGRVNNGEPKCRDHKAPANGERVFVKLQE
jgi:hypothetical protein